MTREHEHTARTRSARRSAARALATAALVAVSALSACGHDERRREVAGWMMTDPTERHPILVSQEPQTIKLHVSKEAHALTSGQRAELLAFADRSRASDAGNSKLVISVPSGAANEVAAMYAVGEIREVLSDYGFSEPSIAVEAYRADRERNPPVRVSYLRYVAQAPQCGMWPANLARQYDNLPYANFGCATQRNLAAMVANPADLLGPRTESDRSSERRDVTWDRYVRGETTTSQKSADEKVDTKASGN